MARYAVEYPLSVPVPPSSSTVSPCLCTLLSSCVLYILLYGRFSGHRDQMRRSTMVCRRDLMFFQWGRTSWPPATSSYTHLYSINLQRYFLLLVAYTALLTFFRCVLG